MGANDKRGKGDQQKAIVDCGYIRWRKNINGLTCLRSAEKKGGSRNCRQSQFTTQILSIPKSYGRYLRPFREKSTVDLILYSPKKPAVQRGREKETTVSVYGNAVRPRPFIPSSVAFVLLAPKFPISTLREREREEKAEAFYAVPRRQTALRPSSVGSPSATGRSQGRRGEEREEEREQAGNKSETKCIGRCSGAEWRLANRISSLPCSECSLAARTASRDIDMARMVMALTKQVAFS